MLNEEENGEAGDTTNQLIYGYQDASPAKSRFTINGKIYQNGELRDTANASHAGFMSKYSYNRLQAAGSTYWIPDGNNIYSVNEG